nr:hypothetical protein BaRGS_014556 [Batillaria attramentaria]
MCLDGRGSYAIRALHPDDHCPMTHFLCPQGYCLPVYLRCNGVYDCPGLEDERDCDKYACPGWLDLSANAFTSVNMQTFASLKNLRVLSLSANPLTSLTNSGAGWLHQNLHTVDLSLTKLDTYNGRVLATFAKVFALKVSEC